MPKKLLKHPAFNPTSSSSSTNNNTSATTSSTSLSSSTSSTFAAVPTTFQDNLPLPTLIVFDLDYTLWPFWVDTHVSSPVKPASSSTPNTCMIDRHGESFSFYADVPSILYAARQRNITLSLASRTHAPDLARDMLRGLHVPPNPTSTLRDGMTTQMGSLSAREREMRDLREREFRSDKEIYGVGGDEKPLKAIEYFAFPQIFPGSKTAHFRKIQEATRSNGGGSGANNGSGGGTVTGKRGGNAAPVVGTAAGRDWGGKEVPFADMLFFDDESRNRNVEAELGVTFWLVRDGVTKEEVDKGVREWRKRRGIVTPGMGR